MRQDVRVCVIGAGAAGLTTIKQLKDQGIHNIECFEKESDLGGVFNYGQNKNGVYDNAILTISNYLMAFSDMPPAGHRYHWHHSEYKEYLQQYAKKFDLLQHIAFAQSVHSVEGGPGNWHVVVRGPMGKIVDVGFFDAVAVCSGAHQELHQPSLPGMDSFTGKIIHSSAYKNNRDFVGKHCVCVGLGESGADIVREISDVAASTVLAMRSFPYLIPRLVRPFHANPLGCSSDAFTSHLRHDLLKVPVSRYWKFLHILNRVMCTIAAILLWLFPSLGTDGQKPSQDAFHQDAATGYMDKDMAYTNLAAALIYKYCDKSGQAERGQKFACKNVTFVSNIVQGRITPDTSGIKLISGDRVMFNSGAEARCDCLVMCTGYKDTFPFLQGDVGGRAGVPLEVPDGNVRRLFKHVFHPRIGKSMAWIGFVRPSTGGIPACAEMAARYFALLTAGLKELPGDIEARTLAECEQDTQYFRLSPDVKTLVGYKDWMDSMAELIGCEVRLCRYILQPRLLVRLCVGSLLPSQYRLSGPCSFPDLSKATILSVPVAVTGWQSVGEAFRSWRRHLSPANHWSGVEGGGCRVRQR